MNIIRNFWAGILISSYAFLGVLGGVASPPASPPAPALGQTVVQRVNNRVETSLYNIYKKYDKETGELYYRKYPELYNIIQEIQQDPLFIGDNIVSINLKSGPSTDALIDKLKKIDSLVQRNNPKKENNIITIVIKIIPEAVLLICTWLTFLGNRSVEVEVNGMKMKVKGGSIKGAESILKLLVTTLRKMIKEKEINASNALPSQT